MQTETTTEKPIGTVTYLDQPVNILGKRYEALVMFPVDGNGRATVRAKQYGTTQGEFPAGVRSFVVVSTFPELGADRRNTLHGDWTSLEQAQRFARSMGRGDKAFAVEVDPYLYAPAFGRVDALT